MSKIIANDIPKELIDLANSIDFSRVAPPMLTQKCAELEQAAHKACSLFPALLKVRAQPYKPTGVSNKFAVRKDVPQELLDVFNKFDFTGFNKANFLIRKPIIATFQQYVKQHLPIRK